jgi:alkylhydroperoxidase family enzyme
MARIPLIDPDDPGADPEVRSTLLELRQRFGADTNYYLALGNNAAALRGILALGDASYFGQHLDLAHTELAYLTASATNECHY